MENPTHSFREMTLVFQLVWELRVKSKTVMSWARERKESAFSATFILPDVNLFNICVLSQCIVYWINFQNIYAFTYQKTLLHALLKPSKTFSASLGGIQLLRSYLGGGGSLKCKRLPMNFFNWASSQ